jgi:hypothetical protein
MVTVMATDRFAPILDRRVLRDLLPGLRADDFSDAIAHLRRELTRRDVASCETWQDAWNLITGARSGRGVLRFSRARCAHCHGRRITHRNPGHNLRMTGNPSVCGDCRGSGKGQQRVLVAHPARVDDRDGDS